MSANLVRRFGLVSFSLIFMSSSAFINGSDILLEKESKILLEKKDTRYIICTSGSTDEKLKEMLVSSDSSVIGLNLENASNISDPSSLFQETLPSLRYLKIKFGVEEVLKILSEKAPNLEILDITGANIFNADLLTHVKGLKSLQVLDISNIYSSEKISTVIKDLLSENDGLTVYMKSLRKMAPQQKLMDLSVVHRDDRVVLKTYNSCDTQDSLGLSKAACIY